MARLETADAVRQVPNQIGQLQEQPRQSLSPWLTTHEAARYLRYEGKAPLVSVYRFMKRHGIVAARRGKRSLLIARADVDRALTGGRRAVR